MEGELLERSDLLESVFDASPNSMAVLQTVYDAEGKAADFTILLVNEVLRRLIGDVPYKGRRHSDVFPGAKQAAILERYKQVADSGITGRFEQLHATEAGNHWFRITAVKQDQLLVVTLEDITERKHAEEAMRQSEARFGFALKAGHLGSWELNLATMLLDASDHCKMNFGQPTNLPFAYDTLIATIHPDDRQRQEAEVMATVTTGKDYDIEYRVIWPDNTLHWVNVRGQLYYDNNGKPVSMIGVSADITDRKTAEIRLSEALEVTEKQKRLYETVTNNTPDLIYVFDLNYRFTYANKALLDMWGKTADESIGKGLRENGYEEWHALMHEREIDEVVATKKPIRGEVSFPHAQLGKRVYDYIFAPVFAENGEVEAIAGSTRDITELTETTERLQKSESRFRNMIEQAPIALLLSRGEDIVIESLNAPMLRFINKAAAEEVLGKKMLEILPELENQPVYETIRNVQSTGIPYRGDEQPVELMINGKLERRFFNFSYNQIKDSAETAAVLHMAVDVTEQVMARQKLEESEARYRALSESLEQQVADRTRELHRSNEDLQQFAHVASHDLKEPVRKVKTFASLLERHLNNELDETAHGFIGRIHAATGRMSTMIDGVLSYSSINGSGQQPQPVDLNAIVDDIASDLEVIIQQTGTRIQYNNLPTLEGAPVLLYQLFYNLVTNSIKFAKEATAPLITITSEMVVSNEEGMAKIIVEDNGIGFEECYATRIFETFTRLNSKDKFEGTGLGLALCKKIVERHRGSITASGKLGLGTRFTILLPERQQADNI